jgi:hypothetical protein
MKAELSPVKQVKIEYWLEVIHKCRASGLTNTEFCQQNNISEKSYYYYLAKIRKMAIEDIPKKNSNLPVDWSSKNKNTCFEEIPVSSLPAAHTDSISIHIGNVDIEMSEDVSEEFLIKLFRAASKC